MFDFYTAFIIPVQIFAAFFVWLGPANALTQSGRHRPVRRALLSIAGSTLIWGLSLLTAKGPFLMKPVITLFTGSAIESTIVVAVYSLVIILRKEKRQ